MKKIKYILLLSIIFCFINVKAVNKCTMEEINRLNELAKNVQFKTSYEIKPIETTNEAEEKVVVDVEAIYKIQIVNNNDDLQYFYKDFSSGKKIKVTANELENLEFFSGQALEIYIYSYTTNLCTDELLRTETIKLPTYNRYYYLNKDKCQENPNFKYCKEFMDINISYDDIDEQFGKYINEKNISTIFNFFGQKILYIMAVSVLITIIILIIVLKINKRKKKLDI